MARTQVARAKKYVSDVEFSAMDASRSDALLPRLRCCSRPSTPATTVNIRTPWVTPRRRVRGPHEGIFESVPNIDKAVVAVDFHNDLGMAARDSLALRAGAAGGVRRQRHRRAGQQRLSWRRW